MSDPCDEFADFQGWLYFNAARQGPLPHRTRLAAERALKAFTRPAEFSEVERFSGADRVRTRFANLIGADEKNVAVGTGTGFGLGLAASSLPQPGDEVLIGPSEYLTLPTSFLSAAKRKGFSVRRLEPSRPFFRVEDIERALTPKTRVLALSAVSYDRGYFADLRSIGELCRHHDLYFVVDACQAAGSVPLNAPEMNIDVLATGAYKWLLSPHGSGLAYFSEKARQHIASDTPSYQAIDAFQWPTLELSTDARALDVPEGAAPFQTWPLASSLELIAELTVERVHAHALALADRLLGQLPPSVKPASCLERERRSAILSLDLPNAAAAAHVHRVFMENRIHLTHRDAYLRFAPHVYNTEADVDQLADVLRSAVVNFD